jgi:hypothetical protein
MPRKNVARPTGSFGAVGLADLIEVSGRVTNLLPRDVDLQFAGMRTVSSVDQPGTGGIVLAVGVSLRWWPHKLWSRGAATPQREVSPLRGSNPICRIQRRADAHG